MTCCRSQRRPWLTLGLAFCCPLVLASTLAAQGRLQVQAFTGEPFGVGRITIDPQGVPADMRDAIGGFPLIEKSGRMHYPAFGDEPVRGLLRNALNLPHGGTAYFLFTGSEPLEITLPDVRRTQTLTIQPQRAPQRHRELLQNWWREYSQRGPLRGILRQGGDQPSLVKNYLSYMLATRLDLPEPRRPESRFAESDLDDALGLMLGTEQMRLQIQRETMLSQAQPAVADRPLPPAFVLPASPINEVPDDVRIEPIAGHVPDDCFYLRCGTFANFTWMRKFLSQAGGELGDLITHRGLDYSANSRLEQQLVLKSSVLSELLGDVVVADVALIGSDAFMREGPALGVLFQARNSRVLASNFQQQRQALVNQQLDVKEELVDVAGRQVSLLTAPGHRVRSYYAMDGDYHLVCTSRALVERFFAAGAGNHTLAQLPEFRQARLAMPLARRDALFLFLSTPFLNQLTSPHYRVEMKRRLQAASDLELVHLARLAARGEGRPAESLEQLVAGGFLPATFGPRGDGSRAVLEAGVAYDSLRGQRGSFLPIPDVAIEQVSAAEIDDYRRLARYSREKIQRLDPLVAGIQRQLLPGGKTERLEIDVRMALPADQPLVFLTQWLGGPADTKQLKPMPDDLVSLEINLAGQHLFAGLRDCNPLRALMGNRGNPAAALLQTLAAPPLDDIVGYIGGTSAEPLRFLGDYRFSPSDQAGYARSNGRLWRREQSGYTVLSFHRQVLESVTPQLEFIEAERSATARLRLTDLRGTQLGEMCDAWGARSAEATTLGNARLLNSLTQQMHVRAAECRDALEQALGARLVCSLKGDYQLQQGPAGLEYWSSTALREPRSAAPADGNGRYEFPLFNWFRGLEADVLMEGNTLAAHLEIEMIPLNRLPNGLKASTSSNFVNP